MYRMSDGSDFDESFGSASFTPVEVVHRTRFGVIRTCRSLKRKEIIFLLTSVLSLVATLALSVYTLATAKHPLSTNSDFFFAVMIIINVVFCIYYAVYGIYWERPFEILVFCIAVVIFVSYLIANFVSTDGWTNVIKIARLVVASVLAPVCLILGFIIVKDFDNQNNVIVRTVGAATEFATACKVLFTLQASLKLDMEMGVTFLALLFAQQIDTVDIVLISIGAPVIIIWFIVGMLASRYEKRWLMWIFFSVGLVCGPAYIIYRMVVAATNIHSKVEFDRYIGIVTMAVACVYLLVRMICLFIAAIVYRNFDKGLKQKFEGARNQNSVPARYNH